MTTKSTTKQTGDDDDSGVGGDEPFCAHGNLLWTEDRDECWEESWALSDAIGKAGKESRP